MKKGYRLKNNTVIYLLVSFGLIFSVGIGAIDLFDLDELYFAEITREMMVRNNYNQITFNFEPLYEKPPLFFWIQAISMHIWGINAVGARFPNILCGLLTIGTLYAIGKKYKGTIFGLLWMCLHGTTFLVHFYFKSGIMDPILNYFVLLTIYFFSRAATGSATSFYWVISSGIAMGCALLTKGPIAAIIPLATVALACTCFIDRVINHIAILKQLTIALVMATIIFSCWLIPEIYANGFVFIQKFWDYHLLLYYQPVDTHHQPWYYHYLVLFFGCFPSSLFTITFFKEKGWVRSNYIDANMQALLVIILTIFTLTGTKIVHYSSMAYYPLTFFAADFLHQLAYNKKNRFLPFLFVVVGTIIGSCLTIIPWVMHHQSFLFYVIQKQTVIDALQLPVTWSYWDGIPGIIYLIGIWIAWHYLLQSRIIVFIRISMFINILSLTLFLVQIAPKIEYYTQKEVVNLCKASKEKDLYITTIGFKAAAPLFYTNKPLEKSVKEQNLQWLLEGAIDKPCLFIVYKSDAALLEPYQDITYLKGSGCFAFYQRLPKK